MALASVLRPLFLYLIKSPIAEEMEHAESVFAIGVVMLLSATSGMAQQPAAVKVCASDIKTQCAGGVYQVAFQRPVRALPELSGKGCNAREGL